MPMLMSDMAIYCNETIKDLNERLLASENLVKQHTKVAEEAISGWEKDKLEYESVKNELEVVREQKRAMEEIVSHLDGALKACMRELRNLREEQEEKIHDAIVKKTKDCENKSLELEEKLRDVSGDLAATRYENVQLLNLVREQSDTISELEKARSQSEESEARLLARVKTFEKETTSLKYEISLVNKELVIRNQEREINRRSSDASRKQHLDDVKKIAKLETEYQRLKNMVRRKLPGSASLVQVKQEIDCSDAEKSEIMNRKWRSATSPSHGVDSPKSVRSESFFKPEKFLSDHGLTMEEEVNAFKEALTKKSKGLQEGKVVNGRPVDKRAMFERHSKALLRRGSSSINHAFDASDFPPCLGNGHNPSQPSISEDGNDDERSIADSWASMLVTEIEQLQSEKSAVKQPSDMKDLILWSESTDDFMEMERIASLSLGREDQSNNGEPKLMSPIAQTTNLSVASEDCIPSDLENGEKSPKSSPELMAAVYKLTQLVAEMSSVAIAQHTTTNKLIKDGNPHKTGHTSHFELGLNGKNFISVGYRFLHRHLELVHFITELSSALGQIHKINVQEANIVRQVEEAPFSLGFNEYIGRQGHQGFTPELLSMPGQGMVKPDVLSDVEGAFSMNASSIDCSEHHGDMKSFVVPDGMTKSLQGHQNNNEVRKLRAEKAALQSHMRAEFGRIAAVEQNLVELKQEKSKLEDMLGQEREKLEIVKRKLFDAEQHIENLQENLQSVKLSRDLAQERLTSTEGVNTMLDSLLKESQLGSIQMAGKMESLRSESIQMIAKMKSLEQSIDEEKARNKDLAIKVETLEDSLERAKAKLLQSEAILVAEKKDEECTMVNANLQLAEYHQTVLALDGQVKEMDFMKNITDNDGAKKEGDDDGDRGISSFGDDKNISKTKLGEKVLIEVRCSPSNTPEHLKLVKNKSSLIKFFTRQKRT